MNKKKYTDEELRLFGVWRAMLRRCGSDKDFYRFYKDCEVSDNFKDRKFFTEWAKDQVGFDSKSKSGKYWSLDKDILLKGNRLYSENICVFVPCWLNQIFKTREASRGECPLGVSFEKDRSIYKASTRDVSGKIIRGRFDTKEEAFAFYKVTKEKLFRDLAEILSHEKYIDPRIPEALALRTVSIYD